MQFKYKASWGTVLWNYFEFKPIGQEKILLKDSSYLELWWSFCSAEWNHLCNLVEDITRKNSVKLFWIWTSGSGEDVVKIYFLSRALAILLSIWAEPLSGTICAIFVEGITRNNSVKLFEFGPVVQEISFKHFKSRAIHTLLVEGIMGSIPVKLF